VTPSGWPPVPDHYYHVCCAPASEERRVDHCQCAVGSAECAVTQALESHAIGALRNCRTVRVASQLSGLGEDQLDGIMARASRNCLARRAKAVPTLLGIHEPEPSRDRLAHAARRVNGVNHNAVWKGTCYAGLLIDLSGGGAIETVEGRTTEGATAPLKVLPTFASMRTRVQLNPSGLQFTSS